MRKRILVTGGAGFIGRHLCQSLLQNGDEVICIDNFCTSNKYSIGHLLENPSFELLNHDITIPISLNVDEIYNLACPASPKHYQRDPTQTIKTSVLGAINMLDLAKSTGARVLQASTSEIYGDPNNHPQQEAYFGNVNPIGIRACYDEGKRCAETLFFDYYRQYDLRIKILRIFNTYGPGMNLNDGRVISNFIIQALNNENITIYGDGSQTRSFCYVDDLIEGMISFMNNENGFTGPVNMGNPAELTIFELAQKIIELTNSKSRIIYQSLPQDDPLRRKPDITLAKEELDWIPKTSLENGLKKTINYFSSII